MEHLKKMGLVFALDDFGTGYSSLSYLSQMPLDILKIDKSFIRGIPGLKDNIAITRTIISLANNLGLQVVAEGVEQKAQLDFLVENGCHRIQGFYFSKPLPASDMDKVFSSLVKKKAGKK